MKNICSRYAHITDEMRGVLGTYEPPFKCPVEAGTTYTYNYNFDTDLLSRKSLDKNTDYRLNIKYQWLMGEKNNRTRRLISCVKQIILFN
jgi:hypothetical protein